MSKRARIVEDFVKEMLAIKIETAETGEMQDLKVVIFMLNRIGLKLIPLEEGESQFEPMGKTMDS